MESKVQYVATYGKNSIPFNSIDQMREYFDNAGDLFDSFKDEIKFYEINVKPINPFENA